MTSLIPSHLESAYDQCQKLAFRHYENFPVASLLLPKESRPHVAALYAFARIADDFADEPPETQKAIRGGLFPSGDEEAVKKWRFKLLNQWDQNFKKALAGKPAPPILQAFAHTVKTFQIPVSQPLNLLKAFRMDVSMRSYATWESILNYCRHSANPVGRMVLTISGIREEKLHGYSDFICSGLQLINFWQDTSVDLSRGRIYYPKAELRKAGVSNKDLLEKKDSPAVRILVQSAVDYTEAYFRKGYPLLDSVSGRLNLELKATYLGGQGILRKIRKMDYNVLQSRPTLSSWEKMLLVLKTLFTFAPP
ncbi:MAG TPA: squalene synthase HpnC [bacterium]